MICTLAALAWFIASMRLRHDAVIRGDDEHDDIRDVGAAGPHGGEGGVAGRVEEGDRDDRCA